MNEKERVLEKIQQEYKNRGERPKKSIIDEINNTPIEKAEEIYDIISDYKNKKDLAFKFLNAMPVYYDRTGVWWRWKEKERKWILSDEVDILNLIDACSGINVITPKERTEIINSLKQEARKREPKPIKKTWIQFDDEIVDIETGERFPATHKYFITNPIPYCLGRDGETPIMDKIFEQWVGKDNLKTLYEIISYCLLPDYPIHRVFCFIGSGLNGKSCYLNLLRKFIGYGNVCSTELDTLLGSRFEVTRLHKKLVCQMGETNFNEMNKTSMLKKLSGGDLIGFEYKQKKPFEDINYAKIIIATNNLPTTTDKTIGFYRRWLIIDFPNQFSEKKDILSEIPEKEYHNLGIKCISLLMDLIRKREFHNEGSIEDRIKKYEAKSNFLEKFLQDFTIQNENAHITKADFYKKFLSWCKENRHREMSETSVGIEMKKLGVEQERKFVDWLYDGKGGQIRVWVGIKWKED